MGGDGSGSSRNRVAAAASDVTHKYREDDRAKSLTEDSRNNRITVGCLLLSLVFTFLLEIQKRIDWV